MSSPTPYQELAEQVLALQQQATAMLSQANGLLRALHPLVEAEKREQEADVQPPRRAVFGKPRPEPTE